MTSAKATLTVNFNAKISSQPANASATVGNTAQFCIAYTANPTATVQWHKLPVGGTKAPISGQSGLCYTTPPLTLADNGVTFSTSITNSMGSVSSNDAVLTVTQGTIVTDTLRATKIVADTIIANVLVTTPKWRVVAQLPDYVFDPDYKLKSLEETEAYIMANRHLPHFSSAKEMSEKGVDLTEMNLQLLKTVEEMSLHLVKMNKTMNAQDERIRQLQGQIAPGNGKENGTSK